MTTSTTTAPPRWCTTELGRLAWEVGATVAAPWADEVDRDARFPAEAVAALRSSGLLGAMAPVAHGGQGASMLELSEATRALASHCSATALVYAMHLIEVAYLIGHGETPGLRRLLSGVATGDVLIANANSEVGLGGDVTRSFCAVVADGDRVHLEKDVLALSYGEYADAITVNARRSPDATENDQVMLVCGPGSFTLEATSTWDTMGLRGTCSSGYRLVADESADMLLTDPWATVANRSGLAATTVFLNSVWLGIAEEAARRAHRSVRAAARKAVGTAQPTALRLAEMRVVLGQARGVLAATIARIDEVARRGPEAVEDDLHLTLELRELKITMTTLSSDVVLRSLAICGLSGYKRGTDTSVERQLRDVLGGQLMANNLRFYAENAQLLQVLKQL
jgi:acyl-CoA dehydrogenase